MEIKFRQIIKIKINLNLIKMESNPYKLKKII